MVTVDLHAVVYFYLKVLVGKMKQTLKAQGRILQNIKHIKLPYMKEVCSCSKHQLNHQLKYNYTWQS